MNTSTLAIVFGAPSAACSGETPRASRLAAILADKGLDKRPAGK